MKIVHIMLEEKFTEGFVSFIFENFDFEEHFFFLTGNKKEYRSTEAYADHIVWVRDYTELYKNSSYKKILEDAEQIIINGVMGNEFLLPHLSGQILKKTWFFFWGADIYCLGNHIPFTDIRHLLKRWVKKQMFRKAAGVITLVPGDYDVLCRYVKPQGKHLVARMEEGGLRAVDIVEKIRTEEKQQDPYKVIVGNSATRSNQHIEALKLLAKYKDDPVQFIVPLSYGDKEYAKEVIAFGEETLGNAFVPLTDFMSAEKYYGLLNECSVGIFNNDRQQALGNIEVLLQAGAKVYLREDTAMWHQLKTYGLQFHDIKELCTDTFEQFIRIPQAEKEQNHSQMLEYYDISHAVGEWTRVFDARERKHYE